MGAAPTCASIRGRDFDHPPAGRLKGGPIGAHFETIEKIRTAFEQAGIEFVGNPNPGVRLKSDGTAGW
jgi:hypothetical protein